MEAEKTMTAAADEAKREVGENLLVLRKALGMKQRELGALINVSHQTIGAWERGQNLISPTGFLGFRTKLGVDPAYFWSGDIEKLPHKIAKRVEEIRNEREKAGLVGPEDDEE